MQNKDTKVDEAMNAIKENLLIDLASSLTEDSKRIDIKIDTITN